MLGHGGGPEKGLLGQVGNKNIQRQKELMRLFN